MAGQRTPYVRITVYVPVEDMTRAVDGRHFKNPPAIIRQTIGALSGLGAAVLGAYDTVSFSARGVGRFRPMPGSSAVPSSGSIGKVHEQAEEAITFVAPRRNLGRIVAELAANHPFQTPAIEVVSIVRHDFDGLRDMRDHSDV
jgi:hypothetical protein